MKKIALMGTTGLMLVFGSIVQAQNPNGQGRNRQGGKPQRDASSRRAEVIGDDNPLAIGDSGVAWYTTWATGLAEARRSNRPVFFMSAATTCSGVPGVF